MLGRSDVLGDKVLVGTVLEVGYVVGRVDSIVLGEDVADGILLDK